MRSLQAERRVEKILDQKNAEKIEIQTRIKNKIETKRGREKD